MRLPLLVAALLAAQPAFAGGTASCSNLSRTQWQELHDGWANRAQGMDSAGVARELGQCQANLPPAAAACFRNLRNFTATQAQLQQPEHGAGMTMDDQAYIDLVNRRNPNLLTPPPEFRDGLPENWKEIVAANPSELEALVYRSGSIANPPYGHYSRVLIRVKKAAYDQWLQFTVHDDESRRVEEGASLLNVIGVERRERRADGTEAALPVPGVSFLEYGFDSRGRNPTVHKPFHYACYSCHPSGLREIVPAPGGVEPEYRETLKKFNREMRDLGDFQMYGVQSEHLGPYRGQNQTCTSCHNNHSDYDNVPRGSLNTSTASGTMQFKMTVEFTMPPGLSARAEYQPYFDAAAKVDSLTKEQRLNLIARYRSAGDRNVAILDFLKEAGKLDSAAHADALEALRKLSRKQREAFDQLTSEDAAVLTTWLKGGREGCVLDSVAGAVLTNTRLGRQRTH